MCTDTALGASNIVNNSRQSISSSTYGAEWTEPSGTRKLNCTCRCWWCNQVRNVAIHESFWNIYALLSIPHYTTLNLQSQLRDEYCSTEHGWNFLIRYLKYFVIGKYFNINLKLFSKKFSGFGFRYLYILYVKANKCRYI